MSNCELPAKGEMSFTFVHYKKEWYYVPLCHVPSEAHDGEFLHTYKFKILDENVEIEKPKTRDTSHAYVMIERKTKACLLPWNLKEEEVKIISVQNNIPLNWLIDQRLPAYKSHKTRKSQQRKCKTLSKLQFSKFIKELKFIDKRVAVIIEILWFLNMQLKKAEEFVTLEQVLRLKLTDVPLEDWERSISLERNGKGVTHLIQHILPDHLWDDLLSLMNLDSLYVFSDKNYIPLSPAQVQQYLTKAAKKVGFDFHVSSLSFRPDFKQVKINRDAVHKSQPKYYVTPDLWDKLCKKIPRIMDRRGPKSAHTPRMMLNAILHWRLGKCTLRKWPKEFPNSSAVETQYRRWVDNGIFNEVLLFLEIKKEQLN